MTLGMRLRTAAVLAALAIALIFAACGGDGGIDVVPDEERQDREDILDRESDGDAGLGDEDSSDAQEDTLDQELDGDAPRADTNSAGPPESVEIQSLDASIAVHELPCLADEAFLRTSDAGVRCVAAADIASIVTCDDGARPVVDLADLPRDSDASPLTMCVPLEDTPDDVFEGAEIDD